MHGSDSAEASDRLLLGRQLSHYLIVERIGAGGMGVVYRARQERLQRDVAIKVLPAGAFSSHTARLRFQREARALARLNHVNIGAIFEFDEQDGIDFIVMEYIEGTSLSERLRAGPLRSSEIVEIGSQLAAGLTVAHQAGVIHRDLKPQNVLIRGDGRIKILDFGLAKLREDAAGAQMQAPITATAGVVGTVPYMAPEQILGRPVDVRSDLWSTGAILYEMAAGKRPFPVTPDAGLIDSILWRAPEPPRRKNRDVSVELEVIILRALQKEPADRFQSADELHTDLRRLSGELPGPPLARERIRRSRARLAVRFVLPLALAALAVVGIYLASPQETAIRSLAVMPFRNSTEDPKRQDLADGMTEGLIMRLSQIKGLKIIARSSVFRYRKKRVSPAEVGRELSVRAVLMGRLFLDRGRLAASAELVDTRDGQLLWGTRRVSETGSVGLQEEIAQQVANRLRPHLAGADKRRLAMPGTRNEAAQRLYLRGLQQLHSSAEREGRMALATFRKATQIDPLYALAHAGLALAYYQMSNLWLPPTEAMPRARAAARRALELDPNLAQAHTVLAAVRGFFDRQFPEAERSFRRAIELNPSSAVAHHLFGIFLTARARFDEAQRSLDRARALDPLSMSIAVTATWPDLFRLRFVKVLERALQLAAVQPRFIAVQALLARAYEGLGRHREALAAVRRAIELGAPRAYASEEVAALVSLGRRADAERRLADFVAFSKRTGVGAYNVALCQMLLGRIGAAFRWLDRSIAARDEELILLAIDDRLKPLWNDLRFGNVLRRLKIVDSFSRARTARARVR